MSTNVKNKKNHPSSQAPAAPVAMHPAIERAITLINKNDYQGAANLLASAGRDPVVRNAMGVCLMRIGRYPEAVAVYRQVVLMPGGVTERPEISHTCKRNFATALILAGLPSGAFSVLAETHDMQHPMTVKLLGAIKAWEKSLSWFRRLDWKINSIEPPHCSITLDFEPGEFEFEVIKPRPDNPTRGSLKLAV